MPDSHDADFANAVTRKKGARWAPFVGIALGLLVAIGALRFASHKSSQPFAPSQAIAGNLLAEDCGSLGEIEFMYTASLDAIVRDTYRDFLSAIDPRTKIIAVVARGTDDRQALAELLASIDPSGALAKRVRVVDTDGPITVWSKDRALIVGPNAEASRTSLVIPIAPDPNWHERTNDWATLQSIANQFPTEFIVRPLPLDFDAGDVAVVGSTIVIDANLFEKNRSRGIKDAEALRATLSSFFGRDVKMIGRVEGDVPRHHMSMYMAALDANAPDGVIMVGDPRAAMAIVGHDFAPGDVNPDDGTPLHADFSDAMTARFDRAAKDLADLGYRVVRVPVIPFDDKTYVTYTNGVYETRSQGDKKTRDAFVPQYGIDRLDRIARDAYEKLGWRVHPIRVQKTYPLHGTIGCLVNVLQRT